MPEVLRRLKTWSHYILTAHPDFEDLVGQQADRRRKLYNGRIECTYYQFHGPKPRPDATTDREAAEPPVSRPTDRPPGSRQQDRVEPPAVRTRPTPPIAPAFGGLRRKAPQQAEMFATGWPSGPGTCGAGPRDRASPATGSTSATCPRSRWSSTATKTACTSPNTNGPTTARRPSTPTGST